MHQQEDNYFTLSHPPFKPQHKSSLINRRQQNSAIPIQPLELPPLSQLLPTTTETAVAPPPPNQMQLIPAYNATTNDISQFINDPHAAAAATAAAMAAANVNINNSNQYTYSYPVMNQPIAPQPQKNENTTRQRQPSNSSQSSTEKQYSFVTIPGVNQKKRPRRRYDEIERLYHCNWPNCTKSYGTLNHLNAHVSMQKHGPKRQPNEFREMRKEWRRQKKERDSQRKRQDDYYPSFHLQPSPMPFY